MSNKKKILFVCQEVMPFSEESEIAKICRYLPQGIQEDGGEVRVFMPKFGNINERRNQLHEVMRLSGMNIAIDKKNHSLIIKVASIQPVRMQVYFIDNEEYFSKKATLFSPKSKKFFKNNDERAIFFAKGVLETVKKLGWTPDIVHCHGWLTGLVPLYLKSAYKDDPLFNDVKIVYSVYDDNFKPPLDSKLAEKILMEGIEKEDVKDFQDTSFLGINKAAINLSDAIVKGSENIAPELDDFCKETKKPMLDYKNEEEYVAAYSEFYNSI